VEPATGVVAGVHDHVGAAAGGRSRVDCRGSDPGRCRRRHRASTQPGVGCGCGSALRSLEPRADRAHAVGRFAHRPVGLHPASAGDFDQIRYGRGDLSRDGRHASHRRRGQGVMAARADDVRPVGQRSAIGSRRPRRRQSDLRRVERPHAVVAGKCRIPVAEGDE
jgi:hypothetical protein